MNGKGTWTETLADCQKQGKDMDMEIGAGLATIWTSSAQEAVMAAMNGVDATDYPQVYIGGFKRYEDWSGEKNWYWKYLDLGEDSSKPFTMTGYTNFIEELTDDGGENCLAFINNPWSGTQRGQWNDVPCNKNLWSYICTVYGGNM
jgi:hypothetical protein